MLSESLFSSKLMSAFLYSIVLGIPKALTVLLFQRAGSVHVSTFPPQTADVHAADSDAILSGCCCRCQWKVSDKLTGTGNNSYVDSGPVGSDCQLHPDFRNTET